MVAAAAADGQPHLKGRPGCFQATHSELALQKHASIDRQAAALHGTMGRGAGGSSGVAVLALGVRLYVQASWPVCGCQSLHHALVPLPGRPPAEQAPSLAPVAGPQRLEGPGAAAQDP